MNTKEKLKKIFNDYMLSLTNTVKDIVEKHKEYISNIQEEVENSDIDQTEFIEYMVNCGNEYEDLLSEEEAVILNNYLDNAISILSTGELNE